MGASVMRGRRSRPTHWNRLSGNARSSAKSRRWIVENLHRTYQDEGLEAAMRRAEGIAVANHELDPNRADGRLFTEGPTDRFTTVREVELMGLGRCA